MRRVAQALNAGTMSLYYYVKTRDELVALMDDALLAEALLPEARSDWPGALLAIARHTHALFLRHPWALGALRNVPPGPNALRHVEQCLHALSETALSAKQKLTLLALVDDFVFGNALRAAETRVDVDMEFVRAELATGAFPELSSLFADGRIEPDEDRFERGLRALIDSVASATADGAGLGRSRARRSPSRRPAKKKKPTTA